MFLGNGHKFENLKVIQDELNSKFLELAPKNCSNIDKIPIMTAGNDIGQKSLIDLKKIDQIEGIILQDVKNEDSQGVTFRQVIYEDKYD